MYARELEICPPTREDPLLDIASTRSYPSVLGMPRKTKKPDALQGTLDLLVLKTLSREPQHGYGVAARIQQIADDALRVEEGSLYPALHRMEQAGWIAAEWRLTENNRRARIYRLTRTGQKRLSEEEAKWDRLLEAVGKVLRFA
jgi:PadR family transcriptional regulator PadR